MGDLRFLQVPSKGVGGSLLGRYGLDSEPLGLPEALNEGIVRKLRLGSYCDQGLFLSHGLLEALSSTDFSGGSTWEFP